MPRVPGFLVEDIARRHVSFAFGELVLATDLQSLSEQGSRRVADSLSAMHQRQAVVISAIVCGSTKPVPKSVPKPVAKMAAQGVLRDRAQADANKAAAAARDADLRPILEAMRDQTYREIAEELTDRGIKTPRGGDTWNQVTVMRSMRRLGFTGK
jgi:hypothetical protein